MWPDHPLDQWLLAHMLIGLPVAVWLIRKDWALFITWRDRQRRKGPVRTAVTALLAALIIAAGWPWFLSREAGFSLGKWLRTKPGFMRWYDRHLKRD